MKKILLLLITGLYLQAPAQKKFVPVTQSALTGIGLPPGTRQDSRLLSVMAGKALLEMDLKNTGVTIGKTELLELPPSADGQVTMDSLKHLLLNAGWLLSPSSGGDAAYFRAEKNGTQLLGYLSSNKKGTSLYLGETSTGRVQETTGPAEIQQPVSQPATPPQNQELPQQVQIPRLEQEGMSGQNGITLATTNFDDGWVSVPQADWVLVSRNGVQVYLHYAIPLPDDLRSSDEGSILEYFWQLLIVPRYSITRAEKKLSPSYEYYRKYYMEAEGSRNGQPVFTGFRILIENGIARCIEIAAPSSAAYTAEFPDPDKIALMEHYNRFAISPADITGTWKESKGGFGQYYNIYSGAYAGMNAVSIASEFRIQPDGTCTMQHKGASGMAGSQQFFEEKATGPYTIGNWEISFTDQHGKLYPFHALYQAVKNGRVLFLQNKQYKGQEYFFTKAD